MLKSQPYVCSRTIIIHTQRMVPNGTTAISSSHLLILPSHRPSLLFNSFQCYGTFSPSLFPFFPVVLCSLLLSLQLLLYPQQKYTYKQNRLHVNFHLSRVLHVIINLRETMQCGRTNAHCESFQLIRFAKGTFPPVHTTSSSGICCVREGGH